MIRMKFLNNRSDDIDYLIECQPTAIKAVRLEAFLPNEKHRKSENETPEDELSPIERRRLEALIDDVSSKYVSRIM